MASKKISQFTPLPAVGSGTQAPVIDPLDVTKNYRAFMSDLIAYGQPDGLYQLFEGEPFVDPTILSSELGRLDVEKLVASEFVSGQDVYSGSLTDGAMVMAGEFGKLLDAPSITTPGDGSLDLGGDIRPAGIDVGAGAFTVDPSGNIVGNDLSLLGTFGASSISSPIINLAGASVDALVRTNATGDLETIGTVTMDASGNILTTGSIGAGDGFYVGGFFSVDLFGIVSCDGIVCLGDVSTPKLLTPLIELTGATPTRFLTLNASSEIVEAAGVSYDGANGIIASGTIQGDQLNTTGNTFVATSAGVVSAAELHAGDGFNGSGIFTTFTIVDGIVTAAS